MGSDKKIKVGSIYCPHCYQIIELEKDPDGTIYVIEEDDDDDETKSEYR